MESFTETEVDMIIDKQLLDNVTGQAKASPRLRKNFNFHHSIDEKCHRFLNAVVPGTVVDSLYGTREEDDVCGGGDMRILKAIWQFCSYLFWPQRKPRLEE